MGPFVFLLALSVWATGKSLVQFVGANWQETTAAITHVVTFPEPTESDASDKAPRDIDEMWVRFEFDVEREPHFGYFHVKRSDFSSEDALRQRLNEYELGRSVSVTYQVGEPQSNYLGKPPRDELPGLMIAFTISLALLVVMTGVFVVVMAPDASLSLAGRFSGRTSSSRLIRKRS